MATDLEAVRAHARAMAAAGTLPAAPQRKTLLARALGMVGLAAASSQLPPPEAPKVKKGQLSVPSHLKSATPPEGELPKLDRALANKDLTTYRGGANTWQVIRDMVASNPDMSASVFAYLRAAITDYVAIAKNRDGTFNREATNLLQQLLARFDILGNYQDGFSGISSMRSNSESLGKELLQYGSASLELVLDKARLPYELAPVSVTTVKFKSDGKELRPFQKIGSDEVDLNIATFFYTALDQDLLEPYSASPMEASIQPALFSQEFMNDLRRIVRKAIHPRVGIKINYEMFEKMVPQDVQNNEEQRREWMNTFISEIEQKVNVLKPEDAVVYFDSLDITYITAGNTNHDAEVKVLNDIVDAKLATGAKAMPSTLGHGSGSQNIASIETLLFMKSAAGAVQLKLNELYSRALTLAVRLFGFDVVVEFRYKSIDLRPDAELEAFKSMHQERHLELLSLGMLTDDQVCLELTGSLPPPGYKPLAGTGFHQKKPTDPNANGYSNTGAGGGDGGAANKRPGGKPPEQAKGPAK